MRDSIVDFFNKVILVKYTLPNGVSGKSSWTTTPFDYCCESTKDEDVAKIIYESIIEYAFNDDIIWKRPLDELQKEAIFSRIRYRKSDGDVTKESYGFYGEVLLNILLRIMPKTTPIIAKGYFYHRTDNRENSGYDSFHFMRTEQSLNLWFGEVKFHQSYRKAIVDVHKHISKALTNDYLSDNLLTILPQQANLNVQDEKVNAILDRLSRDPEVSIKELYKEFGVKLVYPIFIISDSLKDYDTTIVNMINYVNEHPISKIQLDVPYHIFFILLPIKDTKTIKQMVIEWIEKSQQLTLL